jgi:hypothetical protein
MSFSDNLENTLKNLEARQERERPSPRKNRRDPVAVENLRGSRFAAELLSAATRIGHGYRTKVHIFWLGGTLRLEAREHRLEVRPTPEGLIAVFLVGGAETHREKVSLDGKAEALAKRWMEKVGPPPPPPPVPPDLREELGE